MDQKVIVGDRSLLLRGIYRKYIAQLNNSENLWFLLLNIPILLK